MNLEDLKNKSVLLFGKPRAFSLEEFVAQMKHHEIDLVNVLDESVAVSIDGRMMSPYEQMASDALYEKGAVESMSIDALESQLAGEIDADTLLMSLKLSHDKERLKSFLQNSMIDDKLFLRLIKMYDWKREDFFENDDNRDVSAAFIARFYKDIERNHNVQYATTGFIHLVSQTKDATLLKAISELEPLAYHPKIESAIAMSVFTDEALQKKLYKSGDTQILEALSLNKNLCAELMEEFIENESLSLNVARSIELNESLFIQLEKFKVAMAQNNTLLPKMQEKLLDEEDFFINQALAKNSIITEETIAKLLLLKDEKLTLAIYENSATQLEILTLAYKDSRYHEALSKNENTPIEILYQLVLDRRYEHYVKTNKGYGKHIQTQNIGWLVE